MGIAVHFPMFDEGNICRSNILPTFYGDGDKPMGLVFDRVAVAGEPLPGLVGQRRWPCVGQISDERPGVLDY